MANTLKHKTPWTAARISSPEWNEEHAFAGSSTGALLFRDTAATDGGNWLAPVAAGSVLTSNGAAAPAWSATPSLTGLTLAGTLALPNTTSATVGVITKNGAPFFHNYKHATADGLNIFIGNNCGNFTLSPGGGASNLASNNIGVGENALSSLTTGWLNAAFGTNACQNLTSGQGNSGFGVNALQKLTTGNDNAACGADALQENTTGTGNCAVGALALGLNTTGDGNCAMGWLAGQKLVAATRNVIVGYQSMYNATSGGNNVVLGAFSMYKHGSNGNNVVIGDAAMYEDLTGQSNVSIGYQSGYTESVGNANTSGTNNVWVGYQAGPGTSSQLTNSIGVGFRSHPTASNQAVLGNSSITATQLYGAVTITGGGLTHASATLLTTTVALTNGAGAFTGTLMNAPAAGNPTKWIPINDNGTTRYIPAW